ncbi:MAG TPA: (deoxy)nucleoside triphosphate pyrophosphohydrolase [Vicinamibacterales bacterium]|nr:(deoxy)nucleoside triphosphate pyrophosphohydrolase [Vicinamibacterales bacterium]
MADETVIVSAAVIEDEGRYLLTRRIRGVHLEGCWEFPGGKCHDGESLRACLRRELMEELGVDSRVGGEVFTVTHDYPDRRVELHFFSCTLLGAPSPRLGQEMRWVARGDLPSLEFPPADEELIARLVSP